MESPKAEGLQVLLVFLCLSVSFLQASILVTWLEFGSSPFFQCRLIFFPRSSPSFLMNLNPSLPHPLLALHPGSASLQPHPLAQRGQRKLPWKIWSLISEHVLTSCSSSKWSKYFDVSRAEAGGKSLHSVACNTGQCTLHLQIFSVLMGTLGTCPPPVLAVPQFCRDEINHLCVRCADPVRALHWSHLRVYTEKSGRLWLHW